MYVADLVNTFTFLESKFQASNKGHPLRWVDVLSVVQRVGRSDWNVNAVQRKHQIKSSDLFFHFMCEERLFSFSHCFSVGPERYHLGKRVISASLWVVGTVADLWRSPSVWTQVPVPVGVILWFDQTSTLPVVQSLCNCLIPL